MIKGENKSHQRIYIPQESTLNTKRIAQHYLQLYKEIAKVYTTYLDWVLNIYASVPQINF